MRDHDIIIIQRLRELRAAERGLQVEFLVCLGELDRRRLYLALGFSSAYDFCLRELRLTNSSTFRRITAARLLVRFPRLADYLRDGRLCLITVVALRDILEEESIDHVLEQASNKTEEQVRALVARLRPVNTFGPEVELRLKVSAAFIQDLQHAGAALSHKLPHRRVEEVLHECLKLTLKACRKRARGRGRRYVPAGVRDAVWERDLGCCAFIGVSGRCGSTHMLELHHVVRFAAGGAASVGNLSLRCRAHNLWEG